ncbi:MAG: S9 family peptidase [Pseudomonadota bacterium]|nr:S9 family peptidase [Pseudomonadota bacterium]
MFARSLLPAVAVLAAATACAHPTAAENPAADVATEATTRLEARPAIPAADRDMTPVDMVSLARLSDVDLHASGRRALVTRSIADWAEDARIDQYWRYDIMAGTLDHLPALDDADSVAISPDGRRLAVDMPPEGSSRDEVFLADPDGTGLRRLTRHPTSVRSISWSPDGAWIYFLATDDYSEAERDRFARIDPYFETVRHRHLWRVDPETGESQRMTQGNWSVRSYDIAANGTLMIRIAPAGDLDSAYDSELWVSDTPQPGAASFRQVTDNDWMESHATLSPNGRRIAYRARVTEAGLDYVQYNLVVLDIESGQRRILTTDVDFDVDGLAWAPDGSSLIVAVRAGVRSGLVRIDADTGAITELSLRDRRLMDWSVDDSGAVMALFQTPDTNGDVWRITPDGEDTRLTTIGAATVAPFHRPEQQLIRWQSDDGQVIEGFYFPPLGHDGDSPPPLVVQAHGGPRSADEFGQWKWGRYVPVLAARGYGVLWVNYRGGVGYGDDFMRAMHGTYFAHSDTDVLSGVDHLVATGRADPDRLIMSGWSAGGHMTNRLISTTGRFRAAATGASAVDWAMHHLTSDTRGARRLLFGADAWAEGALEEVFYPQSLLRDLHRVTTPTLIFAGENDERVHPSQSIMLYQALRNLGVETRLYLAPGEGHSFSDLSHRLFRINAELDWYARHVGRPPHDWQPLPAAALEGDASGR